MKLPTTLLSIAFLGPLIIATTSSPLICEGASVATNVNGIAICTKCDIGVTHCSAFVGTNLTAASTCGYNAISSITRGIFGCKLCPPPQIADPTGVNCINANIGPNSMTCKIGATITNIASDYQCTLCDSISGVETCTAYQSGSRDTIATSCLLGFTLIPYGSTNRGQFCTPFAETINCSGSTTATKVDNIALCSPCSSEGALCNGVVGSRDTVVSSCVAGYTSKYIGGVLTCDKTVLSRPVPLVADIALPLTPGRIVVPVKIIPPITPIHVLTPSLPAGTVPLVCATGQTNVIGVGGIQKCFNCLDGMFSCKQSGLKIVASTCQKAHYLSSDKLSCKACLAGQGNLENNVASKCTKCLNPLAMHCSIPSVDVSCHSNSYLKDGSVCTRCVLGSDNTSDNSNSRCTTCPGKGSGTCNFNVHPTNITSCLDTTNWKYVVVKHAGVCTPKVK